MLVQLAQLVHLVLPVHPTRLVMQLAMLVQLT
jgi:hypothetical protein